MRAPDRNDPHRDSDIRRRTPSRNGNGGGSQLKHNGAGRLWRYSLGATIGVAGVPVAGLAWALSLNPVSPPLLLVSALFVATSIAFSAIGASLWHRRPESAHVQFGELMIWNWARRRWAERSMLRNAELLGLGPHGTPIRDTEVVPAEQLQVLRDLMRALEIKDTYTRGHTARVVRYVYNTSLMLRLPVKEIEELRKAAAVHDVGKVRVPDSILRKPGPLTGDERSVIQEHSIIGAAMVARMGNDTLTRAVKHHHERWDGGGYPEGLAGRDIPLFARIIAVADTYDAIRSDRPYRSGASRHRAVSIVLDERGSQFDPQVVDAFLATLPTRTPFASAMVGLFGDGISRRILSWVRGTGAGAAAPAAGALGVAVVMGTSLFGPSLPDGSIRTPAAEVKRGDPGEGLPGTEEASMLRDNARPREVKAHVAGKRVSRSGGEGTRAGSNQSRGGGRGGAIGNDLSGGPVHGPPAEAQKEPEGDKSKGPKPKKKSFDPNASEDPQPEHGKDCEEHGNNESGNGVGKSLHCGGDDPRLPTEGRV